MSVSFQEARDESYELLACTVRQARGEEQRALCGGDAGSVPLLFLCCFCGGCVLLVFALRVCLRFVYDFFCVVCLLCFVWNCLLRFTY